MTTKALRPARALRSFRKFGAARRDENLLEALHASCGGELRSGGLHGATHGETEFEVHVLQKQQGYLVSVACRPAGRFEVTRQGALDHWMQGFVPALRFRSFDERFDREFNVRTRDLEFTSALLTRSPNRASVRSLFERGVQAVRLDGERLHAAVRLRARGKAPTPETLLGAVSDLAALGAAVDAFAARHEVRLRPKFDAALVGAWTVLGMLGAIGLGLLIAGSVGYTPVRPVRFLGLCLRFGLPAILPACLALALVVQHRTSPYGLVRGLTGVAALVMPLFVSGALLFANGVLDRSPAEVRSVKVVAKHVQKNKDQLYYSAALQAWWPGGKVRNVRISKATFERLEPEVTRMQVLTHPGMLGHEWIESYAVQER